MDVDPEYAQEFIANRAEVRRALCVCGVRERCRVIQTTSARRRRSRPPRQANKAATAALEAELRDIATRQAELKKVLYARFGKSINLEE